MTTMADRVAERADPTAGGPPDVPPVTTAQSPGPAQRGATPLGLPYPEPTDPLADAAVHLKALSDKASQLLAAPGRAWGTAQGTPNATGDFYVEVGSLPSVAYYQMQCGHRTTALGPMALLLVLNGQVGTWAVWVDCYGLTGAAVGAGPVLDYCWTGAK